MTDPAWMQRARALLGTREIVGPKHSPIIMGWIRKLGAKALGINVTSDETAWCGTFAGIVVKESLPEEPLPPILVRASAWERFGRALAQPAVGAVMVYRRPGGGHVGFYAGRSPSGDDVILGGNQGNAVSLMRLDPARRTAIRWPATTALPAIAKTVVLADAPKSTNEA
jgi:uncharacterized protein (TIGR02594 family)